MRATRHPIALRLFCEAPYVPELFADTLESRIAGLMQDSDGSAATLLQVRRGDRVWHVAGSLDDVLLHTSCILACLGDIFQYLGKDSDQYDFGPPLPSEVWGGGGGSRPLMWFYWARLEKAFNAHLEKGCYTHVVYGDIARCSETLDPDRIIALLKEACADEEAVAILGNMHRSWQRSGCPGIPLVPAFGILTKLYLKKVDDRLREAGITFVRLQDDFRLLCFGQEEADAALKLLTETLHEIGLSTNPGKTRIVAVSDARRYRHWKFLGVKRTLQNGVGLPLLNQVLIFPWLRPVTLKLLARLYGHNCRTMP